jgi:hypothetical protein
VHAARNGHEAVVQLLLELNDVGPEFSEALEFATERKHEKVVQLLREYQERLNRVIHFLNIALAYGDSTPITCTIPVSAALLTTRLDFQRPLTPFTPSCLHQQLKRPVTPNMPQSGYPLTSRTTPRDAQQKPGSNADSW